MGYRRQKIYKKIVYLIDDILRNPFSGIGKPEPLKHQLKGYWSRRINDELKCSPLSRQKTIKVKIDNCTDKRQAK